VNRQLVEVVRCSTNFLHSVGFSGLVFTSEGAHIVKNKFILVSVCWSFAIIAVVGSIGNRIIGSAFQQDRINGSFFFAIVAVVGSIGRIIGSGLSFLPSSLWLAA